MQLESVIAEGVKREVQRRQQVKNKNFFLILKLLFFQIKVRQIKIDRTVVGTGKGSRRSGSMVAKSKSFICFFK